VSPIMAPLHRPDILLATNENSEIDTGQEYTDNQVPGFPTTKAATATIMPWTDPESSYRTNEPTKYGEKGTRTLFLGPWPRGPLTETAAKDLLDACDECFASERASRPCMLAN